MSLLPIPHNKESNFEMTKLFFVLYFYFLHSFYKTNLFCSVQHPLILFYAMKCCPILKLKIKSIKTFRLDCCNICPLTAQLSLPCPLFQQLGRCLLPKHHTCTCDTCNHIFLVWPFISIQLLLWAVTPLISFFPTLNIEHYIS